MSTSADFSRLAIAVTKARLDQPVIALDLDQLDRNITAISKMVSTNMGLRLVAKSLPAGELIDYIRQKITLSGQLVFSRSMLDHLLTGLTDEDYLLGKPFSADAAERILDKHFSAADQVQW